MSLQTKQRLEQALHAFSGGSLKENALALFETLGYHSDKQLDLEPNTAAGFVDAFNLAGRLNAERAMLDRWQTVEFLFQLTKDEIGQTSQISLFSTGRVDDTIIESYLFLAIELQPGPYTRTDLAQVTREVNKQFNMPVLILFKHGPALTFSIINRRLHKRDAGKDVLEKVTLIKDIHSARPHRAHLEILFDLSLEELHRRHGFDSFVTLHRAWQTTLDSSELNKRFFKEIANWYFWAVTQVTFPPGAGDAAAVRNPTSVIRLITRLIFVWFLKEKGLVPADLFNRRKLDGLLTFADPQDSTYYKAILQNLFFATLNQEMGQKREFRKSRRNGQDQHYLIHNLYRYQRYFKDPQAALALFATIPFLNGGLFECLDKKEPANPQQVRRIDGFSDRADNPLAVPDRLFFAEEREIDLNEIYGTSGKRYKVRGLIEILSSYKFTITENTPIEEEIALDPELLGQVFENLLAAYNPETETTARKQTGSFYTPREIVNYMVDESLIAYLETALQPPSNSPQGGENLSASPPAGGIEGGLTAKLRHLLAYNDEPPQFNEAETTRLIEAIDRLKILDPAAGSGAFPMGILHKLVFILAKLDPGNARWKEKQIDKAAQIPDSTIRERAMADIEEAFERNALDYGRKLYLIENCIYGVDLQPIAVQIAKLRFFISLVVDQRIDDRQPNRGVRPLPNLETKFVAANTLLGIERPAQMGFKDPAIAAKEAELEEVRRRHFSARTPATKEKYRQRDAEIRQELGHLLRQSGFRPATTDKLAAWNPYDQNASADFFDPEWMFEVADGFDIVIGNPPYVRQEKIKDLKPALQAQYECYTGTADLYVYFYERGIHLLRNYGVLVYISSNKFIRAGYGQKLRKFLGKTNNTKQIIDFGELPVFDAATFPMIFFAQNGKKLKEFSFTQVRSLEPPYPDMMALTKKNGSFLPFDAISTDEWRLIDGNRFHLLKKMEANGTPLGQYIEGQIYYGIKTGFNAAFIINEAKRAELIAQDPNSAEIIKLLAIGDDVRRWQVNRKRNWLIVTQIGVDISRYPAVFAHLNKWKSQLQKRYDQGNHWWELRACAYYDAFEKPKILYPIIAKEARFAFDDNGMYTNDKVFIIPREDLFLLGVLNSKLSWEYLKRICSVLGDPDKGGRLELRSIHVTQIPVPAATDVQQTTIENLVNQILTAKRANPTADTSALEAEIDRLVYHLYGLTAEEIAIVEEAVGK